MSPSSASQWDVFGQGPLDNHLDTDGCWMVILHICKVFTCIFLFAMVFGGATISIGTVVFAAGNMRLNDTSVPPTDSVTPTGFKYSVLECVTLGEPTADSSGKYVECLVLPRGWSTNDTLSDTCLVPDGKVQSGDVYYTQMCETVGTQWVWCLYLIIVTPYALVFFKCLRRVIFMQKKWPSIDALAVVSCR